MLAQAQLIAGCIDPPMQHGKVDSSLIDNSAARQGEHRFCWTVKFVNTILAAHKR
jgi:hypothetical protein